MGDQQADWGWISFTRSKTVASIRAVFAIFVTQLLIASHLLPTARSLPFYTHLKRDRIKARPTKVVLILQKPFGNKNKVSKFYRVPLFFHFGRSGNGYNATTNYIRPLHTTSPSDIAKSGQPWLPLN